MSIEDIKKTVDEINKYIQKELWFDFDVFNYVRNKLTITGSIDFSVKYDIEIVFEDIAFVSLPFEWQTDTSQTVLSIIENSDEAKAINIKFQVEQGHTLFKFIPEGFPENFGCILGAKSISYKIIK